LEAARRAVASDLAAVVGLAELGIDELEPTRGGPLWARREARSRPVEPSILADLASPEAVVVVGTIDEVVLGYGVVRFESLRDGAVLGVVHDLYVEPDARGVGVGEAMMDLVIIECEARGCIGVDAMALPGNRATKNFFERFGLTARAIVVHRALGLAPPTDPQEPT